MVKSAAIRTILSLVVSWDWPVHQLDVKNVFLHGTLLEINYCSQLIGCVDLTHLDYVCRLKKSMWT
jgi:hypothetical protein